MAISKTLIDLLESAGGEAVVGISKEMLEDATARLTKGALRGHAGAVARLKSLPGHKFMRFFGHAAGHTAGMVVDLLPGLDPETRGLLKAVIQHVGSGAGAGAANVVNEDSWANLVETVAVAPGVAPKRVSDDDEVLVDVRRKVLGEHWPLFDANGVKVKDRHGRFVPRCSVAIVDIDRHTTITSGARSQKKGGGDSSPPRMDGPDLQALPHSQAKQLTDGDPPCRGCMASHWIDQHYQEGQKDWYDKVGPAGEWLAACLRRSLLGRTGLAKAEAKAMMEAVTTAPVKPWKSAATRQIAGRDPAVTDVEILPHAIVEDLLALIDWQGKGEKTKVTKILEGLKVFHEWWRDVGRTGSRRAWAIICAYVIGIVLCIVSLFIVSWLCLPTAWMKTGVLTGGLGALLLIVLLYFLGPLNSIVSWFTDVLPFVERVSDEFFMTVRKIMMFLGTFGIIMVTFHVLGAEQFLHRIVGGLLIGLLMIVVVASSAPYSHLRSMLQSAITMQIYLFIMASSILLVLFMVAAARGQHIIPKEYVMQVRMVDVQHGVKMEKVWAPPLIKEQGEVVMPEIVERGLHTIPSPDGTSHFRVDELSRAYEHLGGYTKNGIACFDDSGYAVALPGYRLERVPGGYGCQSTESAYLVYPTPWRTFWGPGGIGESIEYAGIEDMVQRRHAREIERTSPLFSRVDQDTIGLALLVFGIALVLCGSTLAAKSHSNYFKVGGGSAAVIGVLLIAGSILVYNGELKGADEPKSVPIATSIPRGVVGASVSASPPVHTSDGYVQFCTDLKAQGADEDWRLAGCHNL